MDELSKEQAMFARSEGGGMNLQSIMETYRPTILSGLTTGGGLFTEDLITTMASNCNSPILFPLSNPTTKAECTADQAYEWTAGRCIFASGSPFDPVEMPDGSFRTVSQCNSAVTSMKQTNQQNSCIDLKMVLVLCIHSHIFD
jgi:malate dehydrogenase (oxaloacetate-decarboxylating)(NADP+)